MGGRPIAGQRTRRQAVLLGGILAALVIFTGTLVFGQGKAPEVLRIGTSGSLAADKSKGKEKSALDSLQNFIKSETGLNNEILTQKDWRSLVQAMTDGKVQLGVFQGYEYAWAQEKHPTIKPLALAVNVDRYPAVFVVAKKDSPVKDFAGLQGQALCLPANAPRFVNFYIDRSAQAAGKPASAFFSKVTSQDDPIDALDDVVDGMVQATAVDRATLEVYKKQKPGRFKLLKEVVHSPPLPPVVVTYVDKALDDATLTRFRTGLLDANKKDRGQTMLNTFGLTGFDPVPADFDVVLASTRKTYPPEDQGAK
jgi:ABC-type phosphate/phosphonate transport system substrate-binding protein